MADNTKLSKVLFAKYKQDGDNHPMWSNMMGHVLVSQGFWNIVQGIEVCPRSVTIADSESVEDVAGSRTYATATGASSSSTPRVVAAPLPTTKQSSWDGRDAQAHALIVLSIKCFVVPHICSTKSTKQAWDILAQNYAGHSEENVAYL